MLGLAERRRGLFVALALLACCGAFFWKKAPSVGSPSQPGTTASGPLSLTPVRQHLGKLPRHESRAFSFTLRNEGKVPVHILNIEHTCGCTRAGMDKTVLQPGEKGTLSGSLDAQDSLGEFGSFIHLTFQSEGSQPERLQAAIGAKAVAFAELPSQVDLGSRFLDEFPKPATFEIRKGEAELAWDGLNVAASEVHAEVRQTGEKRWQVTLTPPRQSAAGMGRETLAVTLLDAGRPVKTLGVRLLWKTASRNFSISPAGVYLSGNRPAKVHIKSLHNRKAQIARIEVPSDAPLQVKEIQENGTPCLVFSKLEVSQMQKEWSGKVQITLQDGELEELCSLAVIQMAPAPDT